MMKTCSQCNRDIVLPLYNLLDKKALAENRPVPFCSESCWNSWVEDVIKQHGSPEDIKQFYDDIKKQQENAQKIIDRIDRETNELIQKRLSEIKQ